MSRLKFYHHKMDLATKDIIDEIFDNHDYPVFVDRSDVESYFDELKLEWWKHASTDKSCSFCNNTGSYRNSMSNMIACDTCMLELTDREFDIFEPEDHQLSITIRQFLCQWANKECMVMEPVEVFFDEYGVVCNTCYVCNKSILNIPDTYVAIPDDGNAIAHQHCVKDVGFENYYSHEAYNNIFEIMDIRDMISALDDAPDHIPPMSEADHDILNSITPSVEMDLTEMKNFILSLHDAFWAPINKQAGCIFCHWQCTHYNATLNMHACYSCLKKLKDNIWATEPQNKIGWVIYRHIKDWVKLRCFVEHSIRDKISYDICQLCHRYIVEETYATTKYNIAHVQCANKNGLCCEKIMEEFYSRLKQALGI